MLFEARYGAAAVGVADRVLVAGGACAQDSARVDLYDATTGVWSTASLSAPRHLIAGAAVGRRAFFAGGRFLGAASAAVDVYDAGTGQWSATTMPHAQMDAAAVGLGTKLLVAGGSTQAPTDRVQILDLATGTWTTARLSVPRTDLAGAAVGRKALFAGGWQNGAVPSAVVDVYDDASGSWSVATLSQARGSLAATAVGDFVLFAGGSSGLLGDSAVVDLYDGASGTWSVAALSEPRGELRATTDGLRAFFAGGFDGLSGEPSAVVDVYDARDGSWSVASLSQARWDLSAASAGGRAVFAGGVTWSGCSSVADVYDLCEEPPGESFCGPAARNSTGASAWIEALGCVLAARDDLALVARDLPRHQPVCFLNARRFGSWTPPGSDGVLCLGGPIGRYSASAGSSGSDGAFRLSLRLARTPTPSGPVAVLPGETWLFSAWYRDANPGRTSNFTDGWLVPFQ